MGEQGKQSRQFRCRMRPAGMTVALVMYWLSGVVGAASLPPDDQYSPQQSPYSRDVGRGLQGYPNWLKYRQDLNTRLEPPDNESDVTTRSESLPKKRNTSDETIIRDLDHPAVVANGWSIDLRDGASTKNFSKAAISNFGRAEDTEVSPGSRRDTFVVDDTFQDQGPGSVEVYKLDLLRENSLLVPETIKKQSGAIFKTKSKVPKKTGHEEILWKLKSIEPSKASLPPIFRQPPRLYPVGTSPRELNQMVNENRKDEVFAMGGVPELQVGCEGLEAAERRKRSSGPGEENSDENLDDLGNSQDPIYRESKEPLLLRVTPITLDFDYEPPSDEVYEEMDALLKLKQLESTSPQPTPKRRNRGDIDPALQIHDEHEEEGTRIEKLPERGDLGMTALSNTSEIQRRIHSESTSGQEKDARFRRETDAKDPSAVESSEIGIKDDDTSSSQPISRSGSRKLLWSHDTWRQEYDNQARMRYNQAHSGIKGNQNQREEDLWGFGEDDGDISNNEEESVADKIRQVEAEKRRREYERRRQEEVERRRNGSGTGGRDHRPRVSADVNAEIDRIRMEYTRQLEEDQRKLQRIEEESRRHGGTRQQEDDKRRLDETRRRYQEESRRRNEEEERRNRDSSNSRRMEEEERRREWARRREEEERRRRIEDQRSHQEPPSSLTQPEPNRQPDDKSRSPQEAEERKLHEYRQRNRPIDMKIAKDRQPSEEELRRRQEDENHRRRIEEQRRRQQIEEQRRQQQIEEQRRRQQQPDDEERRRQMEEQRRRQPQLNEENRRRQMEEQRRRQQRPTDEERRMQMEDQRRRQLDEQRRRDRPDNRAMDAERRRRLEEERKLQEYVRRNQPVSPVRSNNSDVVSPSQQWEEQRRTIEAARQYDRNRRPTPRTMSDGRSHGPSAPTNIGYYQPQTQLDELRKRQEIERIEEERRRDSERRRLQEEERRREAEYRQAESRRREEERKRMEEAIRRNADNRRTQTERPRPTWQNTGSIQRPTTARHRGSSVSNDRSRGAQELRRQGTYQGKTPSSSMHNPEEESRRRSDERERQRLQHEYEERERLRIENERNSRNNGRREPQHQSISSKEQRQRNESVRNLGDVHWRRREAARLRSLPVSARIIVRSNNASRSGRTSSTAINSVPIPPIVPSIGSRIGFDNNIDFPAINPNRRGLEAPRFPAPATSKPPAKSPGACVWAIVQCCPANNRLTTCFESMGCPGVNWDPSPCRGPLADAARAEVVRFYEAADEARASF